MTFDDLNDDQRVELKQRILMERNEARGEGTSYGELADADTLVSDEDARAWAKGMEFSPDDFGCGVAADRDGVLAELKEWVEREITDAGYETDIGRYMPVRHRNLEVRGIDWARQKLLDHIEAVRL